MGIEDIMREQGRLPRTRAQQTGQQAAQQQQSTSRTGTLRIEVPDPFSGSREAMLFWMQAAQLLLLLYIAARV